MAAGDGSGRSGFAEMGELQDCDSRDGETLRTWLQTQGHLGAVAAGDRWDFVAKQGWS